MTISTTLSGYVSVHMFFFCKVRLLVLNLCSTAITFRHSFALFYESILPKIVLFQMKPIKLSPYEYDNYIFNISIVLGLMEVILIPTQILLAIIISRR